MDIGVCVIFNEIEDIPKKFAELKEVFAESGEKFTPDWLKNFEGYVNVSTQFELPAILFGTDSEGARIETASIENAIENGYAWMGAEVGLSLDLKEGAVYPRALKFYSEGNAINAFADFDDEE